MVLYNKVVYFLCVQTIEDKHDGKKKLVITDPSLQGAAGYVAGPVSLYLDEDGILHEEVLLRSPRHTDVTEFGVLDIGSFIDCVKDFFCKENIVCEGLPDEEPADVTCLPRDVRLMLFPRRHLRSQKCEM
jgi:hypothetical protein